MKVPGLGNSMSLRWALLALFGVPVVLCVGIAVVSPGNTVAAIVVLVIFELAMFLLLGQSRDLDAEHGVLDSTRMWVLKRKQRFADLKRADLVNNRGGQLLVRVDDGRTTFLPVLTLTPAAQASQKPDFLRVLADSLERHGPAAVVGETVARLREQAAYVASGKPVAQSPLAPLVTNTIGKVAGPGGAAGGGSGLLP